MPKKPFYGWKLLLVFWAVIVLNFAFPTFGMSVVNTYMAGAMHLDRKELGLAYSVFTLMGGLPSPIVGWSINRFGIRLTMLAGILLVGSGAVLMAAVVHTAIEAFLVLALVVGFGAALSGTMGPQVGVARWFHAKRGRAMSLFFTCSGIGGFLAVPSLNGVISKSGGNWRSAWWFMAAMSVLSLLLAGLFIRESPEQMGQEPDGGATEPAESRAAALESKPARGVFKTTEDWTLRETLHSPVLWMLVVTYLGFFMGFFMYLAHGIIHLEGLGHSPAAAAQSLALVMLASVIGQFAVATLGDRIEMRFIFSVAVALFGVGIVLATRATSTFALYPYALCMGAGFGAGYTCLATMQTNYFGSKVYPALLGITIPMGTILGGVGPVIAGWFYDSYHSYSQIFFLVAAICFASAVLLLFAKPPLRRMPRAEPAAALEQPR
ncbi:MAG: MFS transporter [Candidatus Acidiferrales bacterium]